MAVIGNLTLLLDVTSPVTDSNKSRLAPSDIILNLFKKDPVQSTVSNLSASLPPAKSGIDFENVITAPPYRTVRERKANSKVNEVDYEAVIGNLDLLLDVTSFLKVFKKDPVSLPAAKGGIDFEKDAATAITAPMYRAVRGRKANSKFNEVDYESSSDEDNGNGYGDEDEVEIERRKRMEWENEMRMRVKEIEDMRELEKKAEELQSRGGEDEGESGGGDEGDGGDGESEETEEQKRERVRRELEKVAKEQAERRKTAQLMFDLGQKAYGKGMYGRSIEFLEGALTIIPRPTMFGGEIQIWLAMAYEANNRHKDCIDLYRKLETSHPSISIRRQAKDLRYILQAPKLKISQEEMVTIPLIGSSYDSYAGTWSDKNKDRDDKFNRSTTNQMPSGRDYLADLLVWRPPGDLAKNQTFWVALALWVALVGAALFLQ